VNVVDNRRRNVVARVGERLRYRIGEGRFTSDIFFSGSRGLYVQVIAAVTLAATEKQHHEADD
jgi:hypothetical protein